MPIHPVSGSAMPMQPMVTGRRWMVSAGHWLAAEAGAAMLAAGGNAVDAAVAAGITLGVVHPDQVQTTGVAPLLVYLRERDEVVSIAGLGHWPRATRPEVFFDDHGGKIPIGLLRTVVPAAPDAWITALQRYGTMPFHEVVQPAIRCAREGFTVHHMMAEYIGAFAHQYRIWPQNAAIFLPGDRVPEIGDLFVQTDLAGSLQHMADESRAGERRGGHQAGLAAAHDAFYRGDLAAAMVRYHRENGGWLSAEDLSEYRSEVEPAVSIDFNGTKVFSCPAWCQGPSLLQMLVMARGLDLTGMGHNSPAYVHALAETIKLAFADRQRYFGDPRFVDVPLATLLSEAYAAERRRQIDPDRAWPGMPPAGEIAGSRAGEAALPEPGRAPELEGDTSYVCVIDRWGNAVSATPSDTSFDTPVIPGLGFCPSSRGSQSWADPKAAATIAPMRRPRLTPNPSMAIRKGDYVMPFGGPGGDLQPQAMMQVFLNHAVFGMEMQHAIDAPRFVTHSFPHTFEPHLYQPGKLDLEQRYPASTADALAARGHDVFWRPPVSTNVAGVCAIRSDLKRGLLQGGADPRRAARAIGW
ncbi:gamma-glutamyltransferase family protein [Roseomonas sp. 18066]|uniref:gamma-glutamyltransferase family protein n=1 Tax=Roseomonas sp. 18066 TaxID=2681412 RepID=UPI0013584F5F|nr:gamma-glutamyltransferase [Roseomonas sp. 18066]